MGKPKGSQKTGGRKKGTRNKDSINLLELLLENEFDPSVELIDLYRNSDQSTKALLLLKIIGLCYAKPESSMDNFSPLTNIKLSYKV